MHGRLSCPIKRHAYFPEKVKQKRLNAALAVGPYFVSYQVLLAVLAEEVPCIAKQAQRY